MRLSMAWKSLTDRDTGIDKRPHVLAGPILRKVTSKTVTVWFALRKAGKVTVTVLDAGISGHIELLVWKQVPS
jgi:hypothetical protein